MAVDVERLLPATTRRELNWSARDAVIYAHGIGLGRDPLDPVELAYFDDDAPIAFPTLPVSLALTGGPLTTAGLDMRGVLHGGHALTLHAPFPAEGSATMDGSMVGVWDKGPDKGAVFVERKHLRLAGDATPLATIKTTVFGRFEGGCGAPRHGQPTPHIPPDRAPDREIDIVTSANQALLSRLSGDRNPIHSDPARARESGFERPILHGLCTFALCARAVIDGQADREPRRLRHIEARFAAPLYPGETIRVALWRDGDIIAFEARTRDGDDLVIRGGKAIIGSEMES